jgi:hypothetical protein
MTRLRGRFGWKEFNSHSVALCPRAVDIADNFVVLHLMLVIDGGYRNIVRGPVAAMIAVRLVLHLDDLKRNAILFWSGLPGFEPRATCAQVRNSRTPPLPEVADEDDVAGDIALG